MRQIEFRNRELEEVGRLIVPNALDSPEVAQLMTVRCEVGARASLRVSRLA